MEGWGDAASSTWSPMGGIQGVSWALWESKVPGRGCWSEAAPVWWLLPPQGGSRESSTEEGR